MKRQFVNDLQEGDTINDYFVAVRKDLRTKQDGGKFLGMVFRDKTGEIGGILWTGAVEVARQFEIGDVVHVRGRATSYQGRLQMRVESVAPLKECDYDRADLVTMPEDVERDLEQLHNALGVVQQPYLRQLIDAFWQDKLFLDAFGTAAAAKKWHHEFRGGLVRHCYEMTCLTETMCGLFPELDRDLLLTAVFLHDLGKIDEMTHDLHVDYTDAGKLVGHLQIGVDMAQEKMREIDGFPEELRMHLIHCILSHHGMLENGSPVLPKTLEAVVLHHIDNLDAQASAISRIVRDTREKGQEWSEFIPLIDRVIWTKGS